MAESFVARGHISGHYRTNPSATFMTSQPILYQPKPTRPLKRKLWDNPDEDGEAPASNRVFVPHYPSPDPSERSRSDTYLIMAARQEEKQKQTYQQRDQPSMGPRQPDATLPTPGTLRSSSPLPRTESAASCTSTTSTATASAAVSVSAIESRASSRCGLPTYRHDLMLNNIVIEPELVSETVLGFAVDILRRDRSSPGLSKSEARTAQNTLRRLRLDADEDRLKEGLVNCKIVPGPFPAPGIEKGCNLWFDATDLPHARLAPPLPLPRPDHHYCFSVDKFDAEQHMKQNDSKLRASSQPTTSGRWPFFVIEFKSQVRGGTIWSAENQAAGSGAHCVKSMETLLSMVPDVHTPTDSLAFSCTMDAKNADFWVHYYENGKYVSAEVVQYHLGSKDDEEIIKCQNTIQNVLDWALKTRLSKIYEALSHVPLPEVIPDKVQRRRSSDAGSFKKQKSRAMS